MNNTQKLFEGERLTKNGRYEFRITRKGITRSISSRTLAGLRDKEMQLGCVQ